MSNRLKNILHYFLLLIFVYNFGAKAVHELGHLHQHQQVCNSTNQHLHTGFTIHKDEICETQLHYFNIQFFSPALTYQGKPTYFTFPEITFFGNSPIKLQHSRAPPIVS